MDLMQLATQLFTQYMGKTGKSLDAGSVQSALGQLLGASGGNLDLGSLMSKLDTGDMASMAMSWLGDGGNEAISADQVVGLFGSSQVEGFASQLGLDSAAAADGLAGMLPDLIDQNSEGVSLLDMAGGAGGLIGAASKFLK